MANEKTLEILKEMKANPKAKELFEKISRTNVSANIESIISKVAEELGYDITEEDIKEAIEQEAARKKAKTDKVVVGMEALEDDDLENVAGGKGDDACEYDYDSSLSGWCWSEDWCAKYHIVYVCAEVDIDEEGYCSYDYGD